MNRSIGKALNGEIVSSSIALRLDLHWLYIVSPTASTEHVFGDMLDGSEYVHALGILLRPKPWPWYDWKIGRSNWPLERT